jgi:hypothetical protein
MRASGLVLISAAALLFLAATCQAFTVANLRISTSSPSLSSASPRRRQALALRMADLYEDDQEPQSAREYMLLHVMRRCLLAKPSPSHLLVVIFSSLSVYARTPLKNIV